jgi:hypothetical protein
VQAPLDSRMRSSSSYVVRAGAVPSGPSRAPTEWRQQLLVLKVQEGLAEKEEEADKSERGTPDDEYVQPAAGAEAKAGAEGPPRSGRAGPRAGSRRDRRRTPAGGAQEHQASTTADSPTDWGWLANLGQPHRS